MKIRGVRVDLNYFQKRLNETPKSLVSSNGSYAAQTPLNELAAVQALRSHRKHLERERVQHIRNLVAGICLKERNKYPKPPKRHQFEEEDQCQQP